jgi:hypothetical protein
VQKDIDGSPVFLPERSHCAQRSRRSESHRAAPRLGSARLTVPPIANRTRQVRSAGKSDLVVLDVIVVDARAPAKAQLALD